LLSEGALSLSWQCPFSLSKNLFPLTIMAECTLVKDPCQGRGYTWFDWAYNFWLALCAIQSWLGAIFCNTKLSAYGKVALSPVHVGWNAGAGKTIVIPAGAIAIQVVIDNDYAAAFRLRVKVAGGTEYPLPAGTDLNLPAITPMYFADVNGKNSGIGYGFYPEYTVKFPGGSRGYVTAIYRGTTPDISVTPALDPGDIA
jgi:hypothetical protein